jgi:hypothetical protein
VEPSRATKDEAAKTAKAARAAKAEAAKATKADAAKTTRAAKTTKADKTTKAAKAARAMGLPRPLPLLLPHCSHLTLKIWCMEDSSRGFTRGMTAFTTTPTPRPGRQSPKKRNLA